MHEQLQMNASLSLGSAFCVFCFSLGNVVRVLLDYSSSVRSRIFSKRLAAKNDSEKNHFVCICV